MAAGVCLTRPESFVWARKAHDSLRNLERLVWRDEGGESTSVCVASRGSLQILADGRGNDTVRGRNVSEQARPQANSVGCENRRTNTISRGRSTWNECSVGDVLIRSTGERKRTTNIARYKM
jgi:hypothetical protein